MDNIKSFFKKITTKTKIITIIIFFLFIIVILLAQKPSPVLLSNFSENIPAPIEYKIAIENTIFHTLKNYNHTLPIPVNLTLRPNSITENTIGENTTTSFLVDIENLHYSFRVSFYWNKDSQKAFSDPSISISCPAPSEVIYPDTPCPLGTPLEQLKNYLPSELKLKDNTQINLSLARYPEYQLKTGEYLAASLPTCSQYSQLTEAEALIKDWIKSLYITPDDIPIEISCSYCSLNTPPTGSDRCKLSTNVKNPSAPLLDELPYADTNFKILPADQDSTKKLKIILFLDRSSPYYPNHIPEAEQLYLNEALSWIKSRGYNLSDYPYETITEQF